MIAGNCQIQFEKDLWSDGNPHCSVESTNVPQNLKLMFRAGGVLDALRCRWPLHSLTRVAGYRREGLVDSLKGKLSS